MLCSARISSKETDALTCKGYEKLKAKKEQKG